jgi:hypothetical protein
MLAEISIITCHPVAHKSPKVTMAKNRPSINNPYNILLLRRTLHRVGSATGSSTVRKLSSNISIRESTKRNAVSAPSCVAIDILSSSILMLPTPSVAHFVISASHHRAPYPNTSPLFTHGDRLYKSKPSHFAQTETSFLSSMVQTRPSPSGMKITKIRLSLFRRH